MYLLAVADEFEDDRLPTERGCGVVGVDSDPPDDLRESEVGLAGWVDRIAGSS